MSSVRRTPSIAAVSMVAAALLPAGTPEETLRPDTLDAPAATSVEEARRAGEAAAPGHAMSHGTYRQRDAGREDVAITSPRGAARRGSAPAGPGAADPHAGHGVPAPTPDPHAGHTMPAPAATPDPHAGHAMPSPSPEPRW
jgi:hypothetical protein